MVNKLQKLSYIVFFIICSQIKTLYLLKVF